MNKCELDHGLVHNYKDKEVAASLCRPPKAQVHLVAKTSSLILKSELQLMLTS